ncbi:class I SAM-dependent methyltransferase [Pseudalkalibacillus caeni]|uniref:Class I SAM-dependent methyltransferase n=1 Tax=Exobacillus caeni TaxID=2574798 RepID=A0A5R9F2P1_9BACL|nr:class I SAM-dependent methyltransferase [Pseudalkalibacillus caeni]TLS37867.1 class I SAM-dependent methyltransferase [Pseudalkalibacillus caeni]
MIREWTRIWKARKWMKINEPFLYAWHAHIGYKLNLFDAFSKGLTVQEAAEKRDVDQLLLGRWVDVGVAIGHLKQGRKGKVKSKRSLRKYLSKKSEDSVGIVLKEMMELHIPSLMKYPDLLTGHTKITYIDDDFAETVAETSTFIEQFAFPKINKWIKKNNVTSIVDFGCGHGGYLARISEKHKNMNLTGVEKNEEVCKEAANRINASSGTGNELKIYQSDITEWSWNGTRFDMVMMNNLLYYFSPEQRENLFLKAKELTGDKGSLVIISPLDDPSHGHAFSAAFNSFMSAHKNLYPLPTLNEIRRLATRTGFTVKKIQPVVKEGAWYFLALQKK